MSCYGFKRIIEIHRLGINIVTVHVNHGIRGEEAERDENLPKEFAQANGLEFQSYHVNIPMIAKMAIWSEEEGKRRKDTGFSEKKQSVILMQKLRLHIIWTTRRRLCLCILCVEPDLPGLLE